MGALGWLTNLGFAGGEPAITAVEVTTYVQTEVEAVSFIRTEPEAISLIQTEVERDTKVIP